MIKLSINFGSLNMRFSRFVLVVTIFVMMSLLTCAAVTV